LEKNVKDLKEKMRKELQKEKKPTGNKYRI